MPPVDKDVVDKAKEMWKLAYANLNKSEDLEEYFNSVHELHSFMTQNNISQENLREELKEMPISSQSLAIFKQIQDELSKYARAASTVDDMVKESQLVSELGRKSKFFFDCKEEESKAKFDYDKNINVDKSNILIAAMQHIKNIAPAELKIGNYSIKSLMSDKIKEISKLVSKNSVSDETLEPIFTHKRNISSENTLYKHATLTEGRNHRFEASTKGMDINERYQDLRGDALKTRILANMQDVLANVKDSQSLAKTVEALKNSEEYRVLATGQGRATQMLGLKTTSVKAFEKMVKDTQKRIDNNRPSLQTIPPLVIPKNISSSTNGVLTSSAGRDAMASGRDNEKGQGPEQESVNEIEAPKPNR